MRIKFPTRICSILEVVRQCQPVTIFVFDETIAISIYPIFSIFMYKMNLLASSLSLRISADGWAKPKCQKDVLHISWTILASTPLLFSGIYLNFEETTKSPLNLKMLSSKWKYVVDYYVKNIQIKSWKDKYLRTTYFHSKSLFWQ